MFCFSLNTMLQCFSLQTATKGVKLSRLLKSCHEMHQYVVSVCLPQNEHGWEVCICKHISFQKSCGRQAKPSQKSG